MLRFLLRRLIMIPIALIAINLLGFAFAHITFQLQQSQTIYGSGREGITSFWPEYVLYARGLPRGDLGKMPVGVTETIADRLLKASGASLGLLALAFLLSLALGLAIGLSAVQVDPPAVRHWLTVLSTLGLAMPSFYIGTLLVGGLLMFASRMGGDPILPIAGFAWDSHLILPVLVLSIRPTMQIAQVSGSLLAGELSKRYVVAARSVGHTWRTIRWEKALRNVLAPIFLVIAGSFRLLMAELLLVEWLFDWPGLGRLLVNTLVPPRHASLGGFTDTSVFFLTPPLVASLLAVFALLFLLADLVATGLARAVDPRLRIVEEEAPRD